MAQATPLEHREQSAPTRKRPWWSRVSGPQVLMIVAGILAFLANLSILRNQDDVTLVAVAKSSINPGVALHPATHIDLVEVDVSDDLLATLITSEQIGDVEGLILSSPAESGELIKRSQLREAAAPLEQRAMSIAVRADQAVGGDIGVGDVIDVIAIRDGVSRYVLVGVPVLDRATEGRGGALGGGNGFYVVVAVDADQALEIASALDTGDIQIVRSTGAAAPERLVLDPALSREDGG